MLFAFLDRFIAVFLFFRYTFVYVLILRCYLFEIDTRKNRVSRLFFKSEMPFVAKPFTCLKKAGGCHALHFPLPALLFLLFVAILVVVKYLRLNLINVFYYFPKTYGASYSYIDDHPEFYSVNKLNPVENNTQICYEGQGVVYDDVDQTDDDPRNDYERGYYTPNAYAMNQETAEQIHFDSARDMMVQIAAEKIQASLRFYSPKDFPNYNTATLTMDDNTYTCKCDACVASKEKYGTYSASVIMFCNDVNALVQAWMEENPEYKRENFQIIFFAYHELYEAPAVWNEETKRYEAVAPEVQCDKGVAVFNAWMTDVCYQKALYDDDTAETRENTEKRQALCDDIWYWTYGTNFHYYLYMSDTYSFFNGDTYAYLAANNAKGIYNNSQNQGKNASAFHNLKMYLDTKLMWDSSLNEQELIDKWFENMFREVSPMMKRLFTLERLQYNYICQTYDLYVDGALYVDMGKAEYWPLGTLNNWMNICEEAYRAVEKYNTTATADLYASLVKHIDAEYISPAYIAVKLYPTAINGLETFKTDILKKAEKIGLTNSAEKVVLSFS